MTLKELQRRYGDFYSPRFAVTVGGTTFRETSGVLSDLSVDTTLEGADRFSFTLNYRYDFESATFDGMDWKLFSPGTRVEIRVGYGDSLGPEPTDPGGSEANPDPMFVGTISSVKSTFPASGGPTIAVSGYGPLHDLMKGTKSYSWKSQPVLKIVEEVVGNGREQLDPQTTYAFAGSEVAGPKVEPRKTMQDKQHDFEFLTSLAGKYGFELFTKRGVVYFRPNDGSETPNDPVVTLNYGESLRSFSPEVNDAEQVSAVEVRHWDEKARKEIVGTVEMAEGGSGKHVFRVPVDSKAEAERVATSRLVSISRAKVQGTGETIGLPEIVAGTPIRLGGLGEQFDGDYYVTAATHRMGGSGYETSFTVTGRPA